VSDTDPSPPPTSPGVASIALLGRRAVRVEVSDFVVALALAEWIRTQGAEVIGAVEVVAGATTVILDGVDDPSDATARIAAWTPPIDPRPVGPVVDVAVRYDGLDLRDVAAHWQVAPSEVGEVLAEVDLVSAFCGFAPGFAYLAGLPAERWLPRLETPRSVVPAGSVAIADRWCGVYPTASPGGWRLVGRTEAVLFDVRREPPALLAPGTRVRLVPERIE
jgi:KipI family sensor histidine kinase inhibitor